jgi:hypothetical protein
MTPLCNLLHPGLFRDVPISFTREVRDVSLRPPFTPLYILSTAMMSLTLHFYFNYIYI